MSGRCSETNLYLGLHIPICISTIRTGYLISRNAIKAVATGGGIKKTKTKLRTVRDRGDISVTRTYPVPLLQ